MNGNAQLGADLWQVVLHSFALALLAVGLSISAVATVAAVLSRRARRFCVRLTMFGIGIGSVAVVLFLVSLV
jgi:hypothetical protein